MHLHALNLSVLKHFDHAHDQCCGQENDCKDYHQDDCKDFKRCSGPTFFYQVVDSGICSHYFALEFCNIYHFCVNNECSAHHVYCFFNLVSASLSYISAVFHNFNLIDHIDISGDNSS